MNLRKTDDDASNQNVVFIERNFFIYYMEQTDRKNWKGKKEKDQMHILNLYIYVCLFVSNKLENEETPGKGLWPTTSKINWQTNWD